MFQSNANRSIGSLLSEALYYFTHLKRMSLISDVGVGVFRALDTNIGDYLVL